MVLTFLVWLEVGWLFLTLVISSLGRQEGYIGPLFLTFEPEGSARGFERKKQRADVKPDCLARGMNIALKPKGRLSFAHEGLTCSRVRVHYLHAGSFVLERVTVFKTIGR